MPVHQKSEDCKESLLQAPLRRSAQASTFYVSPHKASPPRGLRGKFKPDTSTDRIAACPDGATRKRPACMHADMRVRTRDKTHVEC